MLVIFVWKLSSFVRTRQSWNKHTRMPFPRLQTSCVKRSRTSNRSSRSCQLATMLARQWRANWYMWGRVGRICR